MQYPKKLIYTMEVRMSINTPADLQRACDVWTDEKIRSQTQGPAERKVQVVQGWISQCDENLVTDNLDRGVRQESTPDSTRVIVISLRRASGAVEWHHLQQVSHP